MQFFNLIIKVELQNDVRYNDNNNESSFNCIHDNRTVQLQNEHQTI